LGAEEIHHSEGFCALTQMDQYPLKIKLSLLIPGIPLQMNTFLLWVDNEPPPPYKTFALKDLSHDRPPDTLALEAKLGPVTVTLYDDFGGLVGNSYFNPIKLLLCESKAVWVLNQDLPA
jgi:hypothetical protein